MAVTAADLRAPKGEVEDALFPGVASTDLDARLTEYITDGVARVAALPAEVRDTLVRAWAYHRTYLAVYLRLSANPASTTFSDQGGHQFLITQIKHFKELADDKRAEFDAGVDDASVALPEVEQVVLPPSTAIKTQVRW